MTTGCSLPVVPRRFVVVPAAHVYLVRGREVLLQQRQHTGYMDGSWVAGAAGHIEAGERAVDAAVREAREELGVEIRPDALRPATLLQRTDGTADPVQQRADWYFTADRWAGSPEIVETDKCAALEWFSLDALPDAVPDYEAVVLDGLRRRALEPFTYFGF